MALKLLLVSDHSVYEICQTNAYRFGYTFYCLSNTHDKIVLSSPFRIHRFLLLLLYPYQYPKELLLYFYVFHSSPSSLTQMKTKIYEPSSARNDTWSSMHLRIKGNKERQGRPKRGLKLLPLKFQWQFSWSVYRWDRWWLLEN